MASEDEASRVYRRLAGSLVQYRYAAAHRSGGRVVGWLELGGEGMLAVEPGPSDRALGQPAARWRTRMRAEAGYPTERGAVIVMVQPEDAWIPEVRARSGASSIPHRCPRCGAPALVGVTPVTRCTNWKCERYDRTL